MDAEGGGGDGEGLEGLMIVGVILGGNSNCGFWGDVEFAEEIWMAMSAMVEDMSQLLWRVSFRRWLLE